MAQYGVYALPDGMLVVDLQHDLVDAGTRVVAPLMPVDASLPAITRLEPVFEIEGRRLALHTAELAAIRSSLLRGEAVADLSHEDAVIRAALDMLFCGF